MGPQTWFWGCTQRSADTHHGHRVAGQHLVGVHDDVIGHVGQYVDDCDEGHGDGNGQGQIPAAGESRNLLFITVTRSFVPQAAQKCESG